MSDTESLTQRVERLEAFIGALNLSDRYMISKNIQMQDGRSLLLGGTNGTRFGTSADQKLGFYGTAPVAQPGAISPPSGGSTIDSQARSAIGTIISVLHSLGLTA